MPLTTDDLMRLAAVGISSAEQLIEVARIADRHVTERDASRSVTRDDRAKAMAAERARRHRNSKKINAASEVSAPAATTDGVTPPSRSVTRDASRSLALVSSTPPSLTLEQTVEKEVLNTRKVKGSGNARASRLPDDFVPDETCEAIAREHGFTRAHWQRTIDGFRDYWKAQPGGKGLKADWQATCRNWLRREADNMKGPGNGKAPGSALKNSISDAFDYIDARGNRAREEGGNLNLELLPGLREGQS
jgi:hypothetical protein